MQERERERDKNSAWKIFFAKWNINEKGLYAFLKNSGYGVFFATLDDNDLPQISYTF